MCPSLEDLIGCEVVLDTGGPVFFLGRLISCEPAGFWLEDADLHNTDEGHATREQYIAEAARDGIRVNRHRLFVMAQAVIGVSALSDVITG